MMVAQRQYVRQRGSYTLQPAAVLRVRAAAAGGAPYGRRRPYISYYYTYEGRVVKLVV
jgi:hypothetical protein